MNTHSDVHIVNEGTKNVLKQELFLSQQLPEEEELC